MRRQTGRRAWAFPDGELPLDGARQASGHEALILLNPNPAATTVRLTLYFERQAPERELLVELERERVRSVRLDQPLGDRGFRIPPGQYALLVESDEPIIAQIGRMDVRQSNLAYYTVMGFPLDGPDQG